MSTILLLNGPNLNLLGKREPEIYGSDNLDSIAKRLQETAQSNGHNLVSYQSNAEHMLVEKIQACLTDEQIDFIIFNPGAFTHTSISIRDAIAACQTPFIELHISNIFAREEFRHHSYFSDIASGVICGLGTQGYDLALVAAINYLNTKQKG